MCMRLIFDSTVKPDQETPAVNGHHDHKKEDENTDASSPPPSEGTAPQKSDHCRKHLTMDCEALYDLYVKLPHFPYEQKITVCVPGPRS